MTGHGSPSATALAFARAQRLLSAPAWRCAHAGAIVLCLWFAPRLSAQDPATGQLPPIASEVTSAGYEDHPRRIRITLGGGQAGQWQGQIALDEGALSDLRVAELNADSSGSVWLQDGTLHLASMSPRHVEGIEVSVRAPSDAKLLIDLSPGAQSPALRTHIALSDALRSGMLLKLDDRGNTLKVQRAPGDALNLRTEDGPLIFFPGEQFSFELQPEFDEAVPGTTLDIETTLSPAGRNHVVWRSDQRLAVPVEGPATVVITVPMPRAEGVYQVHVAASRPPGFAKVFIPGASTLLAEHRFQAVVLDAESPSVERTAEWESVLEIDPTSPRWWDRLPNWTQLRRIPGLRRGPLGSIRAGAIEHTFGRFIELPPRAPGGEPHWQAYSLPLEAIGWPHLLEIEYPADEDMQLGVSIVEPNSAGVVAGIGRDSGCYVEGLGRSATRGRTIHQLVFWPRSQAPLLLLTNEHPTAAAHFGQIRVLKRSGPQLASAAREPAGERLMAAFISRPLVVESFGASDREPGAHAFNRPFEASRDDWQAHYEAATRLADYLRHAGYNSAVVNVLGEGRALYRSEQLSPDANDSTGGARPASFDADSLELLLRVFTREQLALVPALQFNAPLPELEKQRRDSVPQTSGLEWVGSDGRTWLETYGASGGRAPYYNLLDPRVQQAMLDVVSDLVEGYGHHPAFAGIAVQLSAHGYAQLPPPEWGLDDATIARFERDNGITIAADGPTRFAARHAILVRQHAEAWRTWRAARVSEFYQRMAGVIRQGDDRRRLLLTSEESLDHAQWSDRIRPNILAPNRVHAALRDAGIDAELREGLPGIVFCPSYYVGPTVPLRDRADDFEINATFPARNQKTPAGAAGALFYHRAQEHWPASFAAKSPFRFAPDASRLSLPLAHGAASRQAYVMALAEDDFTILLDGGALLPIGQEDQLREIRTIMQRLPSGAKIAQLEKQPVLARTYADSASVTLLVMNTSPWPANAQVTLNLAQAATLEPLVPEADGKNASEPAALAAGVRPWSLALAPYEVRAVRIPGGRVQLTDLRASVSEQAHEELAERIAELTERDHGPRLYPSLVNPSCEPLGGGNVLSGWTLAANPGTATAELDATAPRDGTTSIYFESRGQQATLESNSFPVPATGQFAMTVFMRSSAAAPKAELRMVIEADQPGRPYRRAVVIGGRQPAPYDLSEQWRPYPLLVNDLPLESRGQMRIMFVMAGPGEVWLDEIKTYDLLFPLTFYSWQEIERLQLVKLIEAAQTFQEAGKITDCMRLLEGYWPRFLAAYTQPLPRVAKQPARQKDPQSPAAEPEQKTAPGVSEKFKWFIPKLR